HTAAAPKPETKARRGTGQRGNSRLFSPQHFSLKLLSGTAVGIVVITLLAGLFLYVTFQNRRHETLRNHSLDVLRLSNLIANDIAALETIHRGFLLTGDNAYLEPFDRRRELTKQQIGQLVSSLAENPDQRKRVMKIQ